MQCGLSHINTLKSAMIRLRNKHYERNKKNMYAYGHSTSRFSLGRIATLYLVSSVFWTAYLNCTLSCIGKFYNTLVFILCSDDMVSFLCCGWCVLSQIPLWESVEDTSSVRYLILYSSTIRLSYVLALISQYTASTTLIRLSPVNNPIVPPVELKDLTILIRVFTG